MQREVKPKLDTFKALLEYARSLQIKFKDRNQRREGRAKELGFGVIPEQLHLSDLNAKIDELTLQTTNVDQLLKSPGRGAAPLNEHAIETFHERLESGVEAVRSAMPANQKELETASTNGKAKLKLFEQECKDERAEFAKEWKALEPSYNILARNDSDRQLFVASIQSANKVFAEMDHECGRILSAWRKELDEAARTLANLARVQPILHHATNLLHSLNRERVRLQRRGAGGGGAAGVFSLPPSFDKAKSSRVRIFDLTPPPTIDIVTLNYAAIQKDVASKFRLFRWPTTAVYDVCGKSDINVVQRMSYHYFQPYNSSVKGVLLVHSTGSGKSCTVRLCLSIFARAGYDIIIAAPERDRDNLVRAAVDDQCDFNVQQYTRGQDLWSTIERDIISRVRASQSQVQDEDTLKLWIQNLFLSGPLEKEAFEAFLAQPYAPTPDPNKDQQKSNQAQNRAVWMTDVVLGGMGYRQYAGSRKGKERIGAINFDLLSNLVKSLKTSATNQEATGIAKWFYRAPYKEQRLKDPFYRVCIGIDEAQYMTSKKNENERADFEELRKHIWHSYTTSGNDSVRICAGSATPMVDHPVELINFVTLLCPGELVRKLDFAKYGKINTDAERAVTEENFIRSEWDAKNRKYRRESAIRELFAGRISYFNLLGDPTRFSQAYRMEGNRTIPTIEYPPIQLSLIQTAAVTECLNRSKSPERKIIAQRVQGLFVLDSRGDLQLRSIGEKPPKFQTQLLPKAKAKGGPRKEKEEEEGEDYQHEETRTGEEERMVQKCLNNNILWPWYKTPSVADKYFHMDPETRERWRAEDYAPMDEQSPLLAQFLRDFEDKVDMGARLATAEELNYEPRQRQSRARAAQHNEDEEEEEEERAKPMEVEEENEREQEPKKEEVQVPMRNRKHFIFVNTVEDNLGVKNIMSWLQTMGFRAVNDEKGNIKEGVEEYKGVMMLYGKMKKEKKDALLAKFNSAKENIDGKWALVALLNANFMAGTDLFHIYYTYILGFIASKADLVQAVGRGLRNCSRKGTPYPWTVDISIYTPTLPDPENLPVNERYPVQLFQILNPESVNIQRARDALQAIMEDCAYDKLLLDPLNKNSQKFLDHLQLFPRVFAE